MTKPKAYAGPVKGRKQQKKGAGNRSVNFRCSDSMREKLEGLAKSWGVSLNAALARVLDEHSVKPSTTWFIVIDPVEKDEPKLVQAKNRDQALKKAGKLWRYEEGGDPQEGLEAEAIVIPLTEEQTVCLGQVP